MSHKVDNSMDTTWLRGIILIGDTRDGLQQRLIRKYPARSITT